MRRHSPVSLRRALAPTSHWRLLSSVILLLVCAKTKPRRRNGQSGNSRPSRSGEAQALDPKARMMGSIVSENQLGKKYTILRDIARSDSSSDVVRDERMRLEDVVAERRQRRFQRV
jgi:hypothetical protein